MEAFYERDGSPAMDKWVSDCGAVTLYHGDSLAIVPTLGIGAIDSVVTDPPYAFAGGSSNGRTLDADSQFFEFWLTSVWQALIPVVRSSGSQFWFCDWKTVGLIARCAYLAADRNRSQAWTCSQALIWDREQMGMGSPFRSSYEMIAFIRGPEFRWMGEKNILNVVRHRWPYTGHDLHNAEKPVGLCERLVTWSTLGVTEGAGVVLDPFMGSGTTGMACIAAGRRFIGIERERRHFDTALERIQKRLCEQPEPVTETQRDLFTTGD